MKWKFSFIITALFAVILCCSCSSKQDPITDLEDLAFELKENSEDYSQSDWEKAAVKYSEIEEQMQQYEYSDEELKQIGKLKAQCFKAIAKSTGKALKNQMHNLQMQLEGASEEMEGALDEFGDIFEDDAFKGSED